MKNKTIANWEELTEEQKMEAQNFFNKKMSVTEAVKYQYQLKEDKVVGVIDHNALKDIFSI